jgi:hypothetical protein
MTNDATTGECDEDLARVDVRVKLRGGVLSLLEQVSQLAARAGIALDVDRQAVGIGGCPV